VQERLEPQLTTEYTTVEEVSTLYRPKSRRAAALATLG
jgi:hypothetical protein